jgi:hypothetical protein
MVPASPSSKSRRTRRVVEANWFTSDNSRTPVSTMILQPTGKWKLTSNVPEACGSHELRSARSNRDAFTH